ncbi:protein SCAR2-like [Impatiens glandulifera]|uniref:protein SCAR2-like n=1 Tax=Impatiens glandulifera TaxID=253017 RepID=UPI001FB11832|nr:protein SCAR2-like [Impatiens glandulifera]
MPLSRYQIKNEYGLADPELYGAADKDDPEAILEGVAMAGLVGLLRQLGDLAEFAAEIFHDLHEEVMATASRGHGLLVRVQQLEADLPSIERTLLSQTSHSYLLYNSGSDWHPNLRMEQNLITQGDFPRFIMDSYEECRGPPKLFLLDRFDVAGAGACLKRYTDPSFKVDGLENSENHRENKTRKAKKKGSQWMNGGTPQALPKGQTRLHDLLQEERVGGHLNVPAPHVKLKRRLSEFPCNLKSGGSYMEKFLKINSKELDLVSETSVSYTPLVPCNGGSSSTVEEFYVNNVSREEVSHKRRSSSSSEIYATLPKPSIYQLPMEANYELSGITTDSSSELYDTFFPHQQADEKEIEVDGERKMEGSTANSYRSDEIVSDVDNYMDALATIDSDIESDIEYKNSNKYLHNVEDSSKLQENLSDLPDSEPVGSFSSLTDNENLSSSEELSELSSDGIESSDYGIVEDVHRLSEQTLDDLESMYNDIGEEQQQTSSSRRTDSYPVTLSFDLEGSLEGDAFEHSESSEVYYTNNDLFVPSDAAQNFLHVSSSENHLDDQDQAVTSPILIKTVQSEISNYADFTENSTEGDNAGDVPPSKDLMNTVTEEPDIDVKDSFESYMNPFHFSFLHIDVKPQPIVARGGEKQLEFSVLYEEEQPGLVVPQSEDEKPQMLVSHAEEQHQFAVSHLEEESQSVLSYTKEDHNQLSVSNKEEQTQLVVVDIEMQRNPLDTQAEEQSQLTSSQEEYPQLSPSQAEEEQLQLITSSTEEPSPESLDTVSPVNLRLADDGENVSISSDFFMDRRDFVQDDALNLEYSPLVLCAEATNTEQSKTTTAVSISCDRDDVCLSTISVEESHPVVQSFPSSYFLVKPEEIRVPSISTFPRFSLPGPSHNMFDEMPPLPPLPPVQWRTPKFQHAPSPQDIDPPMMSSLDHETKIPHPFSTFFSMKDEVSHHEFNLSSVSIKDSPISEESHLNPGPMVNEEDNSLQEKPIEPLDGLAPETSSENEKLSLSVKTTEQTSTNMNDEKPSLSVSYSSSILAPETSSDNEKSSLTVTTVEQTSTNMNDEKPPQSVSYSSSILAPETSSENEKSSLSVTTVEQTTNMNDEKPPQSVSYSSNILAPETSSENDKSSLSVTTVEQTSTSINDEKSPQSASYASSILAPETSSENEKSSLSVTTVEQTSTNMNDEKPSQSVSYSSSVLAPETSSENEKSSWYVTTMEQTSTNMNDEKPPQLVSYSSSILAPETSSENEQSSLSVTTVEQTSTNMNDEIPPQSVSYSLSILAPETRSENEKSSLSVTTMEQTPTNMNDEKPPQSVSYSSSILAPETSSENEKSSLSVTTMEQTSTNMNDEKPPQSVSYSSSMFSDPLPEVADEQLNGGLHKKLPRPRNPLIDAVVALDKTKLRKVTDRIMPAIGQKVDERNSFLEEIRSKSFNLRPTAVARPSIQGPNKTNLRVAAILAKANSIRQAHAGSDDDDDDEDSWSD